MKEGVLRGGVFDLYTASSAPLLSANRSADILNIVIEGDGYAWVNRYTISDDPTPIDPVGLRIANVWTGRSSVPVIYLARPCQYVRSVACAPRYWTVSRFSSEVVSSYMDALDQLKRRYGNRAFNISGFSGGAYIALVLAAQRDDVERVNSIAGLVDPDAWSNHFDISRLQLSYSSEELLRQTRRTQFYHICSERDEAVPCQLVYDFVGKAHSQGLSNHRVRSVAAPEHGLIWKHLPSDF